MVALKSRLVLYIELVVSDCVPAIAFGLYLSSFWSLESLAYRLSVQKVVEVSGKSEKIGVGGECETCLERYVTRYCRHLTVCPVCFRTVLAGSAAAGKC